MSEKIHLLLDKEMITWRIQNVQSTLHYQCFEFTFATPPLTSIAFVEDGVTINARRGRTLVV